MGRLGDSHIPRAHLVLVVGGPQGIRRIETRDLFRLALFVPLVGATGKLSVARNVAGRLRMYNKYCGPQVCFVSVWF